MVLVGFFFAFTLFFVPETKGKTIEEISRHFKREDVVYNRSTSRENADGNRQQ